jgi:ABC-type multidrug transport system ATPase subunit
MSDTAILVEGLAKRFGDVVALDGIDFQVPAGTVFGLLGPNGAGKTTAIRILATILRPDGGRATVLGRDVVRDPDGVRYRIGLAGQYAAVDPNLTGRENLRLTGSLAQLPRLTTRYLEEADRLADRIAVVDGGRVIANDTPSVLKAELGSTVIELGMGDGARAARAEDLLFRTLAVHPERDGTTVRLTSDNGSRVLIDVLRSLDDHDLAPLTLAVREPSLDDVFLALTGHRAEGAAAAATDGARPNRGGETA